MSENHKNEELGVGLGSRIRSRRKDLGWSQSELAEKVGVSTNTINRVECGHRSPDANLIIHLGEVMGCDVGWLLSGEPVRAKPGNGIPVYRTWNVEENSGEKSLGFLAVPRSDDGDFCVQVTGLSMSPLLEPGDFAIIQAGKSCGDGLICVTDCFGAIQIGRLHSKGENKWLVPENKKYPENVIDVDHIIGCVVGIVRYEKVY